MALFALTNCTEEIEHPLGGGDKVPYTIFANAVESKTVNNGLSTEWSQGDALNVFHAPAGTSDYSYNSYFTITDATTGQFETEALNGELSEVNDWYVQYPYNASSTLDYVVVTLGSAAGNSQKQFGNNSMGHIGGIYYPLFGAAKGVANDDFPHVTMMHMTSLLEVTVTNTTSENITVSQIKLAAEEVVTGSFNVDLTGDEPVFTPVEGIAEKVATLLVSDAEPIAAGESANFYFAIKPFTATAGQKLTLTVDGLEREILLTKDVTFTSGKIKNLSFDYNVAPEPVSVKEVFNYEVGKYALTEGLVVATYNQGFLIQDNTGIILVYEGTEPSASIGDRVKVSGVTGVYDSFIQITSPTITVLETGVAVEYPEVEPLTGEQLDAVFETTEISFIKYTGRLEYFNSWYYNVVVDGAGMPATISYAPASFGLAGMVGGIVTVSGYFIGPKERPAHNCVSTMLVDVELVEAPSAIEATAAEIIAGQDGTNYRMTGYIPEIKDIQWGNYDLKDYSGSVYIYGTLNAEGETKKFAEMGINDGDIVTVEGPKLTYKGTVELMNVKVVEHYPVTDMTISEFLGMADDNNVYYRLSGTVQNIQMDKNDPTQQNMYGNFDLVDDSGSVYVYGLLQGWGGPTKKFREMNIKEGDKVTIVGVRGSYKEVPQVGSAFLVSHEPAASTTMDLSYDIYFRHKADTKTSGINFTIDREQVYDFFGMTENDFYLAMGCTTRDEDDNVSVINNTIDVGIAYQENGEWIYDFTPNPTGWFGHWMTKEGRWSNFNDCETNSYLCALLDFGWGYGSVDEAINSGYWGRTPLTFKIGFDEFNYESNVGDAYAATICLYEESTGKVCRITFNYIIEEYNDPELGLYPTEPTPGIHNLNYEKTLNYVDDPNSAYFTSEFNELKYLMGMTSYQLSGALDDKTVKYTYVFPDGYEDASYYVRIDANNSYADWGKSDNEIALTSFWWYNYGENDYGCQISPVTTYDSNGSYGYSDALKASNGKTFNLTLRFTYQETVVNMNYAITVTDGSTGLENEDFTKDDEIVEW